MNYPRIAIRQLLDSTTKPFTITGAGRDLAISEHELAAADDEPGPALRARHRRSLVRRFRVVHADTGGRARLTASSSCFAATVAPSVRIVPATALARARV